MDYKDEMRKLIDIVKQQSYTAPLEHTLDDMKTMANAVKDISDRIDLRVRKSLQPKDNAKNIKPNVKVFPSIKPSTPLTPKPNTAADSNASSTRDVPSPSLSSSSDARDDFLQKQNALSPTRPQSTV